MFKWFMVIATIFIMVSLAIFGKIYLQFPKQSASPFKNNLPIYSPENVSTLKSQESKVEINLGQDKYQVVWEKIPDISKLFLYPNFTQRLSSRSFLQHQECRIVTNAGFYSKDFTPIGLFISEGRLINDYLPNTFLNGILTVTSNNRATITNYPPALIARISLQSGPLLIKHQQPEPLQISQDASARRVIVSLDQQDNLYIFAVYTPDNVFDGPRLSDLPEILLNTASRLGIRLTEALNLDGGSASIFIRNDLALQELTPVGGYLCVK